MTKYDIIIIGGGPGGYVAALYAAKNGRRVLVIEKDKLGGVCLNCGCIPTKTLITSANAARLISRSKELGITVPSYEIDYASIKARKDTVVTTLTKGIEVLFKAKGIDHKHGLAKIVGKGIVSVNNEKIEAENIIIATGTEPLELKGLEFDGKKILSSKSMLELQELPKKLLIIGGGVNGCEYAYTYALLGVEVTIVEMMDRLLPTMDRELGKNMEKILKKLKIKIQTKTRIDNIPLEYDKAVVCVGRRFNTDNLGLENIGVKTEKGRIIVDEHMQTSTPGIYAIGDAVGGYLLAHVASHEGIIACDNIMSKARAMDYSGIPLCIYTEPQIASVGLSEEEAKKDNKEIKVSKVPFAALGKAHAMNEKEGFLKIIGDTNTDEVLGIHIVGSEATTLIGEASLIVGSKMKIDKICEVIHAHPTLSEAITEAAYLYKEMGLHTL